jgi:hypothetical protein
MARENQYARRKIGKVNLEIDLEIHDTYSITLVNRAEAYKFDFAY